MLPRVFPEGTSGEVGTRLAGRVLDRDAALPRARHIVPAGLSSSRDQPPVGCLVVRRDDLWVELSRWTRGDLTHVIFCLRGLTRKMRVA